jgi:hypothetical protein
LSDGAVVETYSYVDLAAVFSPFASLVENELFSGGGGNTSPLAFF